MTGTQSERLASPPMRSVSPRFTHPTACSPAWAKFQALQAGRDVEADLALHAERLERDRIVGAADQHVAAETDTARGAALRTGVVAGEVARAEPVHRREHAPRQSRLLCDADIQTDLADRRNVT